MALTQPNVPWIMVLFPICHVAVGVGLTYTVLCGDLNKTEIQVNRNSLSVRHHPLPWPGQVSLTMWTNFSALRWWAAGGSDVALYVEQQIECFLHITDRPVGGEMPR